MSAFDPEPPVAFLHTGHSAGIEKRRIGIINSPARRSPVLEAVLNGAQRSYVYLAPPSHPSTGRIGASLVVKKRFDGGRRDVAIAHYRRFDPSSVCFTTLSGTVSPCRSVKTVFRLNPRSSSTTT